VADPCLKSQDATVSWESFRLSRAPGRVPIHRVLEVGQSMRRVQRGGAESTADSESVESYMAGADSAADSEPRRQPQPSPQ